MSRPTPDPAVGAGSTHGPTQKQDPYRTFKTLQSRASSSELVFRVHSPASASPLLWTGDLATSGFASPNVNLAIHTPHSYTSTFLADPPWDRRPPVPIPPPLLSSQPPANRPLSARTTKTKPEDRLGWYLSHTLADHIHGKFRQTCIPMPYDISERPDTPPDEHSPWISTSGSLEWCIWEISRRLALSSPGENETISLAAIKYCPASPTMVPPGPQDLIGMDDAQSGGGAEQPGPTGKGGKAEYAAQELHIYPAVHLSAALSAQRRDFSITMRESYEDAIVKARTSSEVVYYGRIFGESIERNWDFSRQKVGFALPPEFWAPFTPTPEPQAPGPTGKLAKYKALNTLGSGIGRSFLHGSIPVEPCPNEDAERRATNSQIAPPHRMSVPRRESRPHPSESGWLGRLVWDPTVDDFRSALAKMHKRRMDLAREQAGAAASRANSTITSLR